MALARLNSRGQTGLTAYDVSVEVLLAGGLPGFSIAGLPQAAVKESKDRVRAALQTSGFTVPQRRIIVHLGPAEIPKDGGRFDLPIALGVIAAELKLQWQTDDLEFIGELALGGELRAVAGVLPALLAANRCGRTLIIPAACATEASLVPSASVLLAAHLKEVVDHLNGDSRLRNVTKRESVSVRRRSKDIGDVQGQAAAKRAVLIAASGGHNLLMIGPPGSGKSMLAERLPGLLPALTPDQQLELACITSLQGPTQIRLRSDPPFRAPHHTISAPALVGGGALPQPGEASMANGGVLFLDELPEFSRATLEALREPLETGEVRISRIRGHACYPARFQLVAAMNPCPCGYHGDDAGRCRCIPSQVGRYLGRVSGPMLDRFDLHIEVPRVRPALLELTRSLPRESAQLRRQVAAVRRTQIDRCGVINSQLSDEALSSALQLGACAKSIFRKTIERWHLSARGTVRMLKVARTIADIDGSQSVESQHIAEAAQLRWLDRPGVAESLR